MILMHEAYEMAGRRGMARHLWGHWLNDFTSAAAEAPSSDRP
jgi:hypothetical protein